MNSYQSSISVIQISLVLTIELFDSFIFKYYSRCTMISSYYSKKSTRNFLSELRSSIIAYCRNTERNSIFFVQFPFYFSIQGYHSRNQLYVYSPSGWTFTLHYSYSIFMPKKIPSALIHPISLLQELPTSPNEQKADSHKEELLHPSHPFHLLSSFYQPLRQPKSIHQGHT
jgi:hypothetical protein